MDRTANFVVTAGAAFILLFLVLSIPSEPASETVLVGLGCDGASYVAVAREEDKMPTCVSIERHELR